jgi:tetratricopeptide (TPR) repeat protein
MARIAIGQGNWDNYWTLKERIGDLYMSEGRGAEAFDEYRRIAKGLVDSGVGERTSRFFDKFANLYVEAARTEDALAELEEMETSLIEEGKAKEALFIRSQRDLVYEKIEQWPKALEILRSLTLQYQELDDYDSAISALERSVMIRSNTGDRDGALSDQLVMAGLYLKDDDILKARSIFQKLRDELPGSFDVSFRMAEIYFKFEYYDESLPIYLELLEQRPQADEVVSRLAILYARAGELTCAARFAKKVFSRGLVARIIDEYKKAAHYQEANADSHLNMGLFYQEMGFMEEAVLEFQKAAKAPAKLLTAYRLLAQCFRRQGFDDLALRQFQRGLDQPGYSDEETLDLRYHMALTLQEMGRFDEALAALEECYSVDIKYRDVQDRIEEINAILSNKPPGDVIPFETRGSHRQEPDEDSPEALYTEAQADPMEPSSEPSGELFEVYRETGLPELAGEIPELPEEPLEESDSLS